MRTKPISRILCDDEGNQSDDAIKADGIIRYGEDIFESEGLTDKLYETFLNFYPDTSKGDSEPLIHLDSDGRSGEEFKLAHYASFMLTGIYVPCAERAAFVETVDLGCCQLPKKFSYWDRGSMFTVIKLDSYPRGVSSLGVAKHKFKMVTSEGFGKFEQFYFGLKANGDVVFTVVGQQGPSLYHNAMCGFGIVCLNAYDDMHYLWQVETSEDITFGKDLKLNAGVSEEHVKSLFYARSLPVTSTGRKRPILHWVSAHKRRLKEGIDIKIEKYLRGVTSFNMHGLDINIVNPVKGGGV